MAERFSFSNTILEKIPEKAKRETFWDTNIKGLAILVGKKNFLCGKKIGREKNLRSVG
jgi:hypothetical protein